MTISANFPNVKPSLLLDFANAQQLPPSVTFTRATTATYYNGSTTALAEQNLLLYSQALDQSPWTGVATISSTTETAPDGTATADAINPTASANVSRAQSGTAPASATFTASFYAKVASGTGKVYISLLDGPLWANGTSTACSLTTTWQRFTVSRTLTADTTWYVVVGQTDASSDATTCIVWGCQLEQRTTATAYTATTTAAITNYNPVLLTAGGGQPRFDHNPTTSESLGLLIEEQRTNINTYSEAPATGGWSLSPASAVNNTIVSPSGTLTGASLTENGSFTYQRINRAFTISAGTTYTVTVYAKKGLRDWIVLDSGPSAFYNLNTGTVGTVSAGATASMTSVGNGWYRCSYTYTESTTTLSVYIGSSSNGADGGQYTGVAGYQAFYFWGYQVEAASFATSYIPTTTAAATRAADFASMTGANFSSWFNSSEGTIYSDATPTATSSQSKGIYTLFNVSLNNSINFYTFGATYFADVYSGGAVAPLTGTYSSSKTSLGYKLNNVNIANGNVLGTADTSCNVAISPNTLYIGNTYAGFSYPFTGWIKKFAYYPIRVTDAQLQALNT